MHPAAKHTRVPIHFTHQAAKHASAIPLTSSIKTCSPTQSLNHPLSHTRTHPPIDDVRRFLAAGEVRGQTAPQQAAHMRAVLSRSLRLTEALIRRVVDIQEESAASLRLAEDAQLAAGTLNGRVAELEAQLARLQRAVDHVAAPDR